MKQQEIQNKVQEELKQGNWKLVVFTDSEIASISFKSDVLNMLDVQVLMAFNVSTEEHFEYNSVNGTWGKEDLSEVKVEDYESEIIYNGTQHFIDLSGYQEKFSEIISEYYTPHEC